MWQKILQYILKFLLVPLLKEVGGAIVSKVKEWREQEKIKQRIKEEMKKVENAKTPEEIRDAHRNHSRL